MALFIDLRVHSKRGMKVYRFLTNKYSKEELVKKLQPLVDEYHVDQSYLNAVLNGEVLQEDCVIRLKGEAVLTTQCQGSTWYYYPKDKITIHPNGTWTEERYWPWWREVIMFLYQKKQNLILSLKGQKE